MQLMNMMIIFAGIVCLVIFLVLSFSRRISNIVSSIEKMRTRVDTIERHAIERNTHNAVSELKSRKIHKKRREDHSSDSSEESVANPHPNPPKNVKNLKKSEEELVWDDTPNSQQLPDENWNPSTKDNKPEGECAHGSCILSELE
jgi:FtsZ-interacting cell division protein ZipA